MLKKNKPVLNYLELTPVQVVSFFEEGGLITLLEPKFKRAWIKRLVKPIMKNETIKVKLDEFGSEVWKLIDGNRKVVDISNELTNIYGEKIQPAEYRLTKFLSTLMNNDYITFNELKPKGN